jgi:hypothetical protein
LAVFFNTKDLKDLDLEQPGVEPDEGTITSTAKLDSQSTHKPKPRLTIQRAENTRAQAPDHRSRPFRPQLACHSGSTCVFEAFYSEGKLDLSNRAPPSTLLVRGIQTTIPHPSWKQLPRASHPAVLPQCRCPPSLCLLHHQSSPGPPKASVPVFLASILGAPRALSRRPTWLHTISVTCTATGRHLATIHIISAPQPSNRLSTSGHIRLKNPLCTTSPPR